MGRSRFFLFQFKGKADRGCAIGKSNTIEEEHIPGAGFGNLNDASFLAPITSVDNDNMIAYGELRPSRLKSMATHAGFDSAFFRISFVGIISKSAGVQAVVSRGRLGQ